VEVLACVVEVRYTSPLTVVMALMDTWASVSIAMISAVPWLRLSFWFSSDVAMMAPASLMLRRLSLFCNTRHSLAEPTACSMYVLAPAERARDWLDLAEMTMEPSVSTLMRSSALCCTSTLYPSCTSRSMSPPLSTVMSSAASDVKFSPSGPSTRFMSTSSSCMMVRSAPVVVSNCTSTTPLAPSPFTYSAASRPSCAMMDRSSAVAPSNVTGLVKEDQ